MKPKFRWLRDERGAVTVHAALLVVPIVLLLGVLYESVRIQSAKSHADRTAQAAARSVLSAYDRELREEYGLFGLAADEQDQRELARLVAAQPAEAATGRRSTDPVVWSAVRGQVGEIAVETVYSLADHRFFRRQILEEMKIKGPVEFTRHVFNKLKDEAPAMERAPRMAEISEQADRWITQRENRLQEAYSSLSAMAGPMNRARSIVDSPLPDPEDHSEGGNGQEGPGFYRPPDDGMSELRELNGLLGSLRNALQDARQAELKLREQIDDYEEEADLLAGVELYGDAFYRQYEIGAAIPVSMLSSALSARAALSPDADSSFYEVYHDFYSSRQAEEQRRRAAYEDVQQRKREYRRQVNEQLDTVKRNIASQACGADDQQYYERLGEYYDAYIAYNESASDPSTKPPDPLPQTVLEQAPDQLNRSALLGLSRLSETVRTVRDEAYINEYVFMHFNYRTSELSQQKQVRGGSHVLSGQEAEYILYGLHSCHANRAAAYAELFATRFAIRSLESLMDVKTAAASPLVKVLAAAAEGAVKAARDAERLLAGEAVPVFARKPHWKMDYAGYLRTFMALHSRETKKMARIQALIRLNSGIDLAHRPVYIRVKTTSDVKLRFVPAASRIVAGVAPHGGDRSSHRIESTAAMAY